MMTRIVCLTCKYYIGIDVKGRIHCRKHGITYAMYYCRDYEPRESSEG